MPETVHINFTEDDVTWFVSMLSSAAGALGAEAIKMINWLLRFGCAPDEISVFVARLADWMTNSSSPIGRLSRTNGMLPGGA